MTKFKVGDKVKVLHKVEKEEDWDNVWVRLMDKYIGGVFTVESQVRWGVFFNEDEGEFGFPPSSLELVKEEPTKKPRKHAEMIKQWADDDSLIVEANYGKGWLVINGSPSWGEDTSYRITEKPKTKKWKWLLQNPGGEYWVPGNVYTEEEVQQFCRKVIQKVEGWRS